MNENGNQNDLKVNKKLTLGDLAMENEIFRSQTPKYATSSNLLGSSTEILGNIGTFDEAGDFYFKNDEELKRIQDYFGIFYENRVNY